MILLVCVSLLSLFPWPSASLIPSHRVQSQCLPTAPRHLSAPTLSQQLEKHSPTSTKRHSSVSVMAGRTKESLIVVMEIKLETSAVKFSCDGMSTTLCCVLCGGDQIPVGSLLLSGEFEVSIRFVLSWATTGCSLRSCLSKKDTRLPHQWRVLGKDEYSSVLFVAALYSLTHTCVHVCFCVR